MDVVRELLPVSVTSARTLWNEAKVKPLSTVAVTRLGGAALGAGFGAGFGAGSGCRLGVLAWGAVGGGWGNRRPGQGPVCKEG